MGLTRKPWVKTSLAPGSKAVALYLEEAGLLSELEQLGFGIVAFACTTCNGMSGALDPRIQQEIIDRDLYATAVLSGNRNFDGRIHPYAKQAFLASPPLVVAYAIAGTIRFDIERDAFGHDANGKPITLRDLWPSDAEIDAIVAGRGEARAVPQGVRADVPREGGVGAEGEPALRLAPAEHLHPSAAVLGRRAGGERTLRGMRPLALLGDNITTDHLSPSNAILPDSAAGEYLARMGLPEEDFNSYATHRGDHLTALRATFANPTLTNEMAVVDGKVKRGSLARVEPEGQVVRMWEAIETYMERKQPLIIIAGADYGQGSSRDWAAKGVRLAGVEAIVAEGFERIHRTNLVGMGVLPLEFQPGVTRKTLALDGTETFDVIGERTPRAVLTLVMHRRSGERIEVPVIVPARHRRGSLDLRGRRRAAALRAGLPRRQGTLTCFERGEIGERPLFRVAAADSRRPTCAAAPARACSSACRTCPRRRRCRARRATRLFMRVIGSPDPYAAHIDGMGGATSSTSKCVILSQSSRPDHDVDYLYGQVAIDKAFVDWSGNCGNLSTAVGAFAIHAGLVDPSRIPRERHLRRAHLAGQHRQDHHCARAGHERPGAGDRRFRARRRDLPGRGNRPRVHRPVRRRRGQWLDVPDRQPRRRPRGAGRRARCVRR